MHPFSVVIIARNEAHDIGRTLEPLRALTDDIVVVDSGSTDGTQDIARSMGARVIETEWLGYARTKNLGNDAARHDWVLSLDADEVVSPELARSLQAWQPRPDTAWAVDVLTNFCGQWVWHSGWYPDWKVRLFNRHEVRWVGEYVHEHLDLPAHYRVERLHGKLWHYSYRSEADYLAKMEQYARLSAEARYRRGQRPVWWRKHLGPAFRIFRTLVLKQGWRDGRLGWKLARLNARMVRRRYELLEEMWRMADRAQAKSGEG